MVQVAYSHGMAEDSNVATTRDEETETPRRELSWAEMIRILPGGCFLGLGTPRTEELPFRTGDPGA